AESDLAVALGIPMYGADPAHLHFGTKSGSRRLFAEEGVSHPDGAENLRTFDDLVRAIRELRARRPDVRSVIVKHDEGVTGEGNATIDVRDDIEECVRGMRFESSTTTFEEYMAKLEAEGGIVEERVTGEEIRSPSVQMRVTPLGELEILS